MNRESVRILKEGAGYGVVAGVVLAVAGMFASLFAHQPVVTPFRLGASVAVGADALVSTSSTVIFAGLVAHLFFSAVFGFIYALVDMALSRAQRSSYAWQSGLGLCFGLALWFVNFQVVARVFYPWLLEDSQLVHALLHAA